jgi:hypothetical protein
LSRDAPGGNSGLKYRVHRFDVGWRGFEYQVIDDAGYKNRLRPSTTAGALYALFEPNGEKQLNALGEFNTARIVVKGDSLQHWLNGRLIVTATIDSPEWQDRLARSKFAELPGFGKNRRGRIMLTDHGSEVWYRNFEFQPLAVEEQR